MKKLVNNAKEENYYLQEMSDAEINDLENGGLCFFWKRCVGFKTMARWFGFNKKPGKLSHS